MDDYFPPDGIPIVKMYRSFPEEQFVIHPDGLRRMLSCGVYSLSRGNNSLYIGSARNVLARISDESHESFRQSLCEADWVSFIMAKSEAAARDVEAFDIALREPKYNIRGKSKTSSIAKAIWNDPANGK